MRKTIFFIASLLLISNHININAQAQPDTLDYRTSPFQLTFMFPPFSTNGPDNANYVNGLSLNPFIGYSGGVDGIELAGFINVDRYFVKGLQAAGFGNTVGGDVDGIQAAGFYNAAGGDVKYLQGAGFINVTGGNQTGLQGAGFANVVGKNLYGFQGAGFANVVGGKIVGVQGAGFMNVAGDTVEGMQGAGFMNVAGGFDRGVQAAGFGNVAGGKVNLQASGFFNVAEEIEGAQAAGFFNRAGYVNGLQVAGFLNVCDSIDGVPIAFISIVKHGGYRAFQLSASETQYINAAFKLGVPKLYTIYSFGKPSGPGSRWMYGLGLGTRIGFSERSTVDIELNHYQEIWIGDERAPWFVYQNRFNSYNQLSATYSFGLADFAEAFIGPTLNVSVGHTHPADDIYIPWEPIAPSWSFADITYDNTYHDTNVALWLGVKAGIRLK